MLSAIEQLRQRGSEVRSGNPVTSADLAKLRRNLLRMNIPDLPKEYIDFIKQFNGASFNQGFVFGLCPCGDFFLDILKENMLWTPRRAEQLLLGYNEFDLLIWDSQSQTYQLVDKADGQVIQIYSDFNLAIADLLKTDDEQYLF